MRQARVYHHAAFAGAVAIIALAVWLTGAVPARAHPADALFFADTAWRALSGLRPHVDFVSSWGPVTYLALAAGFKLAGDTLDGVGVANAVVGLVIGIWSYWMLLKRVPPWIAVFGGILLAVLTVTPVSLGYSFELTSQAMFYNRYGFALTGIVLIECFPLGPPEERGLSEGFSSGAALSLLFFLKASYFGVALMLIAFSLLWQTIPERRRLAGIAAGCCAASIPLLAYLRFDVRAMYSDLSMSAHARSQPLSLLPLGHLFLHNLTPLIILSAVASVFQRWKYLVLTGLVFAGGILLLSTNAQPERLPLNEVLALLLVGALLSRTVRLPAAASFSLAAAASAMFIYPFCNDLLGIADGLNLRYRYPEDGHYIAQVKGFDRFIMSDKYANRAITNTGRFLKQYLEDGSSLLQRELRPGEVVTTFDLYNPFPYVLGSSPPTGGVVAAAYGLIYNDEYHPPAGVFFGSADLVMYPKVSLGDKVCHDGLEKIYGSELRRRFQVAAESEGWILYRRIRSDR